MNKNRTCAVGTEYRPDEFRDGKFVHGGIIKELFGSGLGAYSAGSLIWRALAQHLSLPKTSPALILQDLHHLTKVLCSAS